MRGVLVVLVLAGCGVFPNHEAREHPTEPLEHQMPTGDNEAFDRVRGVVQNGDEMFPMPVQFVVVELLQAGRVMRSTNTDHDGHFVFRDEVPAGTYELRLRGDYVGTVRIDWPGRARDGVVIKAQPR